MQAYYGEIKKKKMYGIQKTECRGEKKWQPPPPVMLVTKSQSDSWVPEIQGHQPRLKQVRGVSEIHLLESEINTCIWIQAEEILATGGEFVVETVTAI